MGRLKLFLPLIVFVLIASVFLTLQQRRHSGEYDPSHLPSALIDKPLPQFSMERLNKELGAVSRDELLGRPFVLNVWATWCISCRVEHAYLNEISEAGIRVIGLNYKDERAEAKQWLERLGNPYELNLFDELGNYGIELGVYGAPESYFVDAQGIVRYRHVGVLDQRVWQKRVVPLGLAW